MENLELETYYIGSTLQEALETGWLGSSLTEARTLAMRQAMKITQVTGCVSRVEVWCKEGLDETLVGFAEGTVQAHWKEAEDGV